jgi:hypothetical protein
MRTDGHASGTVIAVSVVILIETALPHPHPRLIQRML